MKDNNKIRELENIIQNMIRDSEQLGIHTLPNKFKTEELSLILDALRLFENTSFDEVKAVRRSLFDTVEGMLSPDYKERFIAEYIQTKIRYERLKAFNTKIEAAHRMEEDSDFLRGLCDKPFRAVEMPKHECPEDILLEQQNAMGRYLHILEIRAVIEGVDLASC